MGRGKLGVPSGLTGLHLHQQRDLPGPCPLLVWPALFILAFQQEVVTSCCGFTLHCPVTDWVGHTHFHGLLYNCLLGGCLP